MPCSLRTSTACCTATSSRGTSSSMKRITPSSATSAWRNSPSARRAGSPSLPRCSARRTTWHRRSPRMVFAARRLPPTCGALAWCSTSCWRKSDRSNPNRCPRCCARSPSREPDAMAPSVPSDLRIIASKALAKDPARRYVSSRALADDLRCWLEGRPITARPTPGAERLWLWMRRNPALAAVSVLAGLGIAAAISSLAWGLDRAKQEAKNMAAARDQIASANKEGQEQLRDALVQEPRRAVSQP